MATISWVKGAYSKVQDDFFTVRFNNRVNISTTMTCTTITHAPCVEGPVSRCWHGYKMDLKAQVQYTLNQKPFMFIVKVHVLRKKIFSRHFVDQNLFQQTFYGIRKDTLSQ